MVVHSGMPLYHVKGMLFWMVEVEVEYVAGTFAIDYIKILCKCVRSID